MAKNSEATTTSRSVVALPEKTTSMFTQTCDRLREFLKEQRAASSSSSPPDPAGRMSPLFTPPPPSAATRTIDLFPTTPTGQPDQNPKLQQQQQQQMMTIFYGGKVIVLENVPSDKATEVMRLATTLSTSSSCSSSPAAGLTPGHTSTSSSAAMSNLGSSQQQRLIHQSAHHAFVRDLSLTRSRSLTRFLEKRKDRINARAPYTLSSDNSSKPPPVQASQNSWLGLAAPNH